jgi:drug/metabolite transporter (DMT)-like permease
MSPAGLTVSLGLSSAAVWGTSDFVGGIAARRIRSSAVVAMSHFLSLILLVSVALLAHSNLPDRASAVYGIIAGVACGLGVILLYKALALGGMGITASVSGVLAALLPVVFAFTIEGVPRPRQWIGFLVAGTAIWLIAAAPGGHSSRMGLLLGAGAGVSFGVLFIFLKLAGEGGVLWPLACSRLASSTLAAAITLIGTRRPPPDAEIAPPIAPGPAPDMEGNGAAPGMSWAVLGLASISGVLDATGNAAYTLATRLGRLDIAAVLSSLYPAATILLAAWLLRERTTRTQKAGMALALGAVVLISA